LKVKEEKNSRKRVRSEKERDVSILLREGTFFKNRQMNPQKEKKEPRNFDGNSEGKEAGPFPCLWCTDEIQK